jgi:hypothetical protein
MSTHPHHPRRQALRDRCEVCDAVITQRPVPTRRRCADHLDQLVLLPLTAIKKTTKNKTGKRARGNA